MSVSIGNWLCVRRTPNECTIVKDADLLHWQTPLLRCWCRLENVSPDSRFVLFRLMLLTLSFQAGALSGMRSKRVSSLSLLSFKEYTAETVCKRVCGTSVSGPSESIASCISVVVVLRLQLGEDVPSRCWVPWSCPARNRPFGLIWAESGVRATQRA